MKRSLALVLSLIVSLSALVSVHTKPVSAEYYEDDYICRDNNKAELKSLQDEDIPSKDTKPDSYTQRITVVDYETGQPVIFSDDNEYNISFHTSFAVEYFTPDGKFMWGSVPGGTSIWNYNANNPYEIDVIEYDSGFGADGYVIDSIDLPNGYLLPEENIEAVEYDNHSTDIFIKIKKTQLYDVNCDGSFNVLDVINLQRWLLNVPDTTLENFRAADINEDGVLNILDFCLVKSELIKTSEIPHKEVSSKKVTVRYSDTDELADDVSIMICTNVTVHTDHGDICTGPVSIYNTAEANPFVHDYSEFMSGIESGNTEVKINYTLAAKPDSSESPGYVIDSDKTIQTDDEILIYIRKAPEV